MEKLPNWLKWVILLAAVAGIALTALWLNDYVSRVEQLPPDAGLFGASSQSAAE